MDPLHITRFGFFRHTVRGKLVIMLLAASLIPMLILGGISYYSFTSLLQNKIEIGIYEKLEKEKTDLENTLNSMNFTSQQMVLDGKISEQADRFLDTDDPLIRKDITIDINQTLTLINFTNPNIGILALIDMEKNQVLFQNYAVSEKGMKTLPIFSESKNVVYHSPHTSFDPASTENETVLSLLRNVELSSGRKIAAYVETNFRMFPKMFGKKQYGQEVRHVLTDSGGKVVYSEDPSRYAIDDFIAFAQEGSGRMERDGRFVFFDQGLDLWRLMVTIDKQEFNHEVDVWLFKYLAIGLFALLLGLLLAFLAWRTMNRPLRSFKREIMAMANNPYDSKVHYLSLAEFDEVLFRFSLMKQRIGDLLQEIRETERNKRRLEVEKLLYQINPHFIHNTLSTVQVLAKLSGQEELVRLVNHFASILHYNLGKEGTKVTVSQEVDNLKNYIALQQIRYNSRFQIELRIDPLTESMLMPRFLLQPLVENAMYHGFRNRDGTIEVIIERTNDGQLSVAVCDNGEGMSTEEVQRLFGDNPGRNGLGVGLRFVDEQLRAEYGETCRLMVESVLGKGTVMKLIIPIQTNGGVEHD